VPAHGDLSAKEQIIENTREGRANLDRMLSGSSTLSCGIERIQQTYTATELKNLRQRKGLTPQLQDKLVRDILSLAGEHNETTSKCDGPSAWAVNS
jgi:hypothetical protein